MLKYYNVNSIIMLIEVNEGHVPHSSEVRDLKGQTNTVTLAAKIHH